MVRRNILTTSELASFAFGVPGGEIDYPEIKRNAVSVFPPPMNALNPEIKVGVVTYRGKDYTIGFNIVDLLRHLIISGKTGTGKSVFTLQLFQEIIQKYGCLLADPHQDLYMDAISVIPDEKLKDTILLDFTDTEYPVPFNVFYLKNRDDISVQEKASKILAAFKKAFSDCWGARTEHIFRNTFKTVLEYPSDIYDVKLMITSEEYRCKKIPKIKNPETRAFWINEFYDSFSPSTPDENKIKSEMKNAISSPLNKLGKFIDNEYIKACMVQPGCIDARAHMDSKKVVLANLNKTKLEDAGDFIGSLLISEYRYNAFTRQDMPKEERIQKAFGILYDEFENVVSEAKEDIQSILEELRKFGLFIIMIHQYLEQITPIYAAVFGNAGSSVSFRMGDEDSLKLTKHYGYGIAKENIARLPNRYAMAKLLVQGQESRPFIFKTMDMTPPTKEETEKKHEKLQELHKQMFPSREVIKQYYESKIGSIYEKPKDDITPIFEEHTKSGKHVPDKTVKTEDGKAGGSEEFFLPIYDDSEE